MYPVTEQWKAIDDKTLRNHSYIRIVFGITDPDAPALSEPIDNGHLPYSDVDSVDLGTSAPATYQTLEHNRFILDGKNPLPVEVNPLYQGYVGYGISDSDGVWSVQPSVTVTFSDYVQFPALTFQFDESMDEYPEQLLVIAEHDGDVVLEEMSYPDSAYWVYDTQIPLCNKLKFVWVKSKIPRRRARLISLIYGLINNLETQDIVSCSSTKEVDLLSSKIPKQDFEFTLIDTQRKYDPENPKGVWEYLESRQPVTYYYGYELDDGTVEWIPWGQSYSTGDFEVTKQGKVSNVSIKCAGLADHLNMVYDEGVYSQNGTSLFDLAMDVMRFAGYDKTIELDNALKDIVTHNPLPKNKVNECLQLIANAGRCIMSHSRGGYISILRENTQNVGFDMTFKKILDAPQTNKIPPLRNLTTEYSYISVDTELSDAVSEAEVKGANNQEFTFTHQAYTNLSVVATGVTVVGTPKYYAYKTVVTLSGTGTITVKGNRLNDNKISYKKKYSEVGEDLEGVSNKLIDNLVDVTAYADWLAGIALRRNTYTATDRGYPQVDIGDTIGFTSNFQNDIDVSVVKQKLTFNGAIKGEGQYIIGGGANG